MALLTQLHSFLSSKSSITTLTGTRIYQTHLPQSFDWSGTAVSMNKISERQFHHLTASSGVATARVQIDVWGTDEDQVDAAAEAIRLVLQSYSGAIGTVTCLGITLENVVSLPEEPTDASSQWRQHIASDYMISYRNTVAPA
jgi:hypothetical protein